jgi:hypothetical protein
VLKKESEEEEEDDEGRVVRGKSQNRTCEKNGDDDDDGPRYGAEPAAAEGVPSAVLQGRATTGVRGAVVAGETDRW